MEITREIFTKATAEAMKLDSTAKLFKDEPSTFETFSLFAYTLLKSLEGKDITEEEYSTTLAEVIVGTVPEISYISMLMGIALTVFGAQLWGELEKLGKPEKESTESDNFESELKSLIGK